MLAIREGNIPELLRVLRDQGFLRPDQVHAIIHESNQTGEDIEVLISRWEWVNSRDLLDVISNVKKVPLWDIETCRQYILDLNTPPDDLVKGSKILPFCDGEVLWMGMVEPDDLIAFQEMKKYFPHIKEFRRSLIAERTFSFLYAEMDKSDYDPDHVVSFLRHIMEQSVYKRVTDIHIVPGESCSRILYRIDGTLKEVITLHKDYAAPIILRIKVLARIDVSENKGPGDGRFSECLHGAMVDFRVSIHPTVWGDAVVMRVLDQRHRIKSLTSLGYTTETYQALCNAIKRPCGLTLITGPTGSGKTTTLFTLLEMLQEKVVNIMTLEDPVEYRFPSIRQTQVDEMGFAAGVRSLLRQDPDVIMVGEIRDEDTAQMVFRAASMGLPVLSTMHTDDSFGAVVRLVEDFSISPVMITKYLNCVVNQRLIKRVCTGCKLMRFITEEEAQYLDVPISTPVAQGAGCHQCRGTGYYDRYVASEVLDLSRHVDKDIFKNFRVDTLYQQAYERGFKPLRDDALHKVLSYQCLLESVQEVVG